jgi:hypothetical protein
MAVSRALRRLLRIRQIEEEHSRLTLESALGELHRLEHALAASGDRERWGRSLVIASVQSGELPDRLAGIEETRWAGRHTEALVPLIATAEEDASELREEFLMRRVDRRQAETLIQETEAKDAIEDGRRSQQAIDDWHRSRQHRESTGREPVGQGAALTARLGEELPEEGRESNLRENREGLCSNS